MASSTISLSLQGNFSAAAESLLRLHPRDPRMRKALQEAFSKLGAGAKQDLQMYHQTHVREFTGDSWRAIKYAMVPINTTPYFNLLVGYLWKSNPEGEIETSTARAASYYFGELYMKGFGPGVIIAPRKGVSGKGVFGGEGWDRVGAWAAQGGEIQPTRKAIWRMVYNLEQKGQQARPILNNWWGVYRSSSRGTMLADLRRAFLEAIASAPHVFSMRTGRE